MDAVRQQYKFVNDGGQILLSHGRESDIHVTCKSLTAFMQQAWDNQYDKETVAAEGAQIWILDDISDSTSEGFNCYAKAFTRLQSHQEQSIFMRATLSIASKLSTDRNVCLANQRW